MEGHCQFLKAHGAKKINQARGGEGGVASGKIRLFCVDFVVNFLCCDYICSLHESLNEAKLRIAVEPTYHAELIGSTSVTTRNMYSTHVISLHNKLAIRIRKPVEDKARKSILKHNDNKIARVINEIFRIIVEFIMVVRKKNQTLFIFAARALKSLH